MVTKVFAVIFISGLILTGCATQGNWQPTVDSYGDKNAGNISNDMVACKQLALGASGGTAKKAAQGAIVGGAIGAAAGAALGAATGGSPGKGAAVGAAALGIGGAVKEGLGAEEVYKKAYINCMRNRGHNVINP